MLAACSSASLPEIPQEAIDEAVAFIMGETLVRDAAIVVDGDTVSLAVIVSAATSTQYAQTIGENFADNRELAMDVILAKSHRISW